MTSSDSIICSQRQYFPKTTTCSLCFWGVDVMEGAPRCVVLGAVKVQPVYGCRMVAKHVPAPDDWNERK